MSSEEVSLNNVSLVDQSRTQRFTIVLLAFFLGVALVLNTFYFYRLNARADAASAKSTSELNVVQTQNGIIHNLQSQLQDANSFNQLLGSLIIESSQNPTVPLTPTQKQTLAKLKQLLIHEATQSSVSKPSTKSQDTTTSTSPPPTTPRPRPPPASTTTTTTTTTSTLLVCVKVPTVHIHIGC